MTQPYGMHGGGPGERGASYWVRAQPDGSVRKIRLRPSGTVHATRGDKIIMHTPGGGGYGTPGEFNGSVLTTEKTFVPRANGSVNAWSSMQETN